MIKIRTIISFFSVFFCFAAYGLDVQMIVKDTQGYELEQAQVGKPFLLEVTVEGTSSRSIEPTIEGADQFDLRRTGYQFSSSGRSNNLKISYLAQISTPGSHSFGPAIVQDGAYRAQSDVLLLKAGNHEKTRPDDQAQEKQRDMVLVLSTDQANTVVGQRLEGEIKLFYRTPISRLQTLRGSPVDGFFVDEKSVKQEVGYLDGQQYNCASWKWQLYPNQSGELVLPSCSIDLEVRQEGDSHPFWGSFFGPQVQRIRLHSNALTVNIASLPAHSGPVDAVGRFENFSAKINQATAKEGDAIVVTLSIDGDADLENLNLELQNVPHVFKSYSSKKHVELQKNGALGKKLCEHIIQGMEAGEWELPKQKFTFFDVATRSYKTLTTSPLLIKIFPQTTAKTFVPPSVDDIAPATTVDTTGQVEETKLKLNLNGSWKEIPERKMPWWLFMVLFLAPIGIWFSAQTEKWFRRYVQRKAPKTQWRNAFKIAHKKLNIAKKKKDFPAIYRTLVDLFAIRCSVEHAQVSDQMIKQVLQSGGLSQEELAQWDRFFADASAFIFYTVEGADSQMQLFDQADKWVTQLEGVI